MPQRYIGQKSLKPYLARVALDPVETSQKVEGAGNLYKGFMDSVAYLHGQNANLSRDFLLQRRDLKRTGRDAIQASVGESIDRGVVGSSNDALGRGQVWADMRSQQQAARGALQTGQMGNVAQMMQARRDYRTGLMNLAMAQAAAQQNKSVAKAMEGTWGGGSGGGGNTAANGGMGGGGMGGGGGGAPTGPSPDLGGLFGTGQTLRQLGAGDLNDLKTKQLEKLWRSTPGGAKGKITNRLQGVWKKWEDKGYQVYWDDRGRLMKSSGGGRGMPEEISRGTMLANKRDKVKTILGGRYRG